MEPDGRRVVAQPASRRRPSRGPRLTRWSSLLPIDEADPRRLVDGREQPLVLEAESGAQVASRDVARSGFDAGLDSLLPGSDGTQLIIHVSPVPCRISRAAGPAQLLERRVQREARVPGERLGERGETAVSSVKSGQAARAPSRSERLGIADQQRPGCAPCCMPSPSQVGHQPSGLLNEKWCGVSGSKLRPQRSQAKCWL